MSISNDCVYFLLKGLKRHLLFQNLHLETQNPQITEKGFANLNQSLRVFRGLKRLDLIIPEWIRRNQQEWKEFGQTLEQFALLESLELRVFMSESLNSEAMKSLSKAFENFKFLKHLHLQVGYCPNVDDESLVNLKDGLAGLATLQSLHFLFSYCPNITDLGVVVLRDLIVRQTLLKEMQLKIFGCKKEISSKIVKWIFDGLERQINSLQILNIAFTECHLTKKEFACLSKRVKMFVYLEKISFTFGMGREIPDVQNLSQNLKGLAHLKEANIGFLWSGSDKNQLQEYQQKLGESLLIAKIQAPSLIGGRRDQLLLCDLLNKKEEKEVYNPVKINFTENN